MTANDNSNGDSKEVPDRDDPIDLGLVEGNGSGDVEFHTDLSAEIEYTVTAYPADYRESEGEFGIQIEESVSFAGGVLTRYHSFNAEAARELAARLIAAADKLGHEPDDDAPQPAEL